MHPAFSVIFFTTLSGTGYGLLFWLGLLVSGGMAARRPMLVLVALLVAALLITIGLLSSVAHLGRPERAWRAFSQWRSSWLSREGVVASLSYVPMAMLAWSTWQGGAAQVQLIAAMACSVFAVLTVFCTARIYTSLTPIAAWHNRWVLPNFLLLGAAGGAVWLWAIGVLGFSLPAHRGDVVILIVLLLAAALAKLAYWRHVDRAPARVSAADAMALPAGSRVTPFEAPHTEANFLLKEMGYALARKHGQRLRRLAPLLFAVVPVLLLLPAAFWFSWRPVAALLAPGVFLLGVLVERWLFFAQARHTVMTYYDTRPA